MTLYQLVEPGWPIIWGTAAGTADMRSMLYCQGPEKNLMSVALIEMAKFYGVPCSGLGRTTDSKTAGFLSGLECTFSASLLGLAGVDNIWGGLMDGGTLVDLPYLLLATEAVRQVNHLRRGLVVNDQRLMIELILKMGFDARYMEDVSTAEHFRDEHLMAGLFPREKYEDWMARGQSEEMMAVDRVKATLEAHEPEPLPVDVSTELQRIMSAAGNVLVK